MAYIFNTELKSVAINYATLIGAKVTATSLDTALEENPHYPSLLSLCNTFREYNIDNEAYRILGKDFNEIISELPFVAFVKLPNVGTDFVLVTDITDKTVSYQHKKNKTISKDEFLAGYQNIVWKATLSDKSGEANYENKLKKEKANSYVKYALFLTIFSLLISVNIPQFQITSFSVITSLKIVGLAVSITLLLFDIDKSNAFVKNLCSIGGKTNCDAVLGSKAAKIFGITWSEIGFYYFSSTAIGLLLPNISFETKINCIAFVNILALPYTCFSIYFQWKVVKQWCPLCLVVQFILLSEFLWGCFFVFLTPVYNIFEIRTCLTMLFCVLVPVLTWHVLKPILIKAKDNDLYKPAYKRLLYNSDIFKTLLAKQDKVPNGWEELGIDIGDKMSDNILIKICNPYCKPCEKSHLDLENIINSNQDIRLKIIYISHNNEYDKGAVVAKHLLSIAAEGNNAKIQSALDDWYLNVEKDYNTFAQKYPLTDKTDYGKDLEKMRQWCDTTDVTHTPTVFLNGYKLPENYTIEDLKYVL